MDQETHCDTEKLKLIWESIGKTLQVIGIGMDLLKSIPFT